MKIMPKGQTAFFLCFILFSAVFSRAQSINLFEEYAPEKRLNLVLGDGPGGAWYALGVLQAVEKYRLPVTHLYGSGWGLWVAALWSQGYSLSQLEDILRHAQRVRQQSIPTIAEQLGPTKPAESSSWLTQAISEDSVASVEMRFSFRLDSLDQIHWVSLPHSTHSEPRRIGRNTLSDLLLQQPLLSLKTQGRKQRVRIPWQSLVCREQDQTIHSIGRGSDFSLASVYQHEYSQLLLGQVYYSMEHCTAIPVQWLLNLPGQTLFAASWTQRSYPGLPASWTHQIHQGLNALQQSSHVIGALPHHGIMNQDVQDSSAAWIEQGFMTMRAQLGKLHNQGYAPQVWPVRTHFLPSLTGFTPVFTQVPSDAHAHLAAYWREEDHWEDSFLNFVDSVVASQLYEDLDIRMVLQKTSEHTSILGADTSTLVLGVQATPRYVWKLGAGALGSSPIGFAFHGSAGLTFISQYAYSLFVEGLYGDRLKGLLTTLKLSQIQNGDIEISGVVDIRKWHWPRWSGFYRVSPYSYLEEETRQDFVLSVPWYPSVHWAVVPNVRFGSSRYATGVWADRQSDSSARSESRYEVNLLDVGVDLSRHHSVHQQNWFDQRGTSYDLDLHLRSAAPIALGTSPGAPLYGRIQGKAQWGYDWLPWLSTHLRAAGGVDFRYSKKDHKFIYPESLQVITGVLADPALSFRYKQHIELTPFASEFVIPHYYSFHYLSASADLGLHDQGSGFWLTGGVLRDFEGEDLANGLKQVRFALEPCLRLRWHSIDLKFGLHFAGNRDDWGDLLDSKEDWITFIQLGAFPW